MVVHSVAKGHELVAQVNILDHGIAVSRGNIIVTEIPEAPDSEGIEFIQYRFHIFLGDTENRGVDLIAAAISLKLVVVSDNHLTDGLTDLSFIVVKAGDEFKAQLVKAEVVGKRGAEVADADEYRLVAVIQSENTLDFVLELADAVAVALLTCDAVTFMISASLLDEILSTPCSSSSVRKR